MIYQRKKRSNFKVLLLNLTSPIGLRTPQPQHTIGLFNRTLDTNKTASIYVCSPVHLVYRVVTHPYLQKLAPTAMTERTPSPQCLPKNATPNACVKLLPESLPTPAIWQSYSARRYLVSIIFSSRPRGNMQGLGRSLRSEPIWWKASSRSRPGS